MIRKNNLGSNTKRSFSYSENNNRLVQIFCLLCCFMARRVYVTADHSLVMNDEFGNIFKWKVLISIGKEKQSHNLMFF